MTSGGVVILGSLLMTPVMPGKPFSANYEKRVAAAGAAEEVERGTIVVDGRGRARGAIGGTGAQAIAAIWDPVQRAAWIVEDSSNRILMNIPWPEVPVGAPAIAKEVAMPSKAESLGVQMIDGLECDGTRVVTQTPHGVETIERWISRDLGHVLAATRSTDKERLSFRMFVIS